MAMNDNYTLQDTMHYSGNYLKMINNYMYMFMQLQALEYSAN